MSRLAIGLIVLGLLGTAVRSIGAIELPELPADPERAQPRVTLTELELAGHQALGTAELAPVVAPFLAGPVDDRDLAALQREIENEYHRRGFLGASARIPDQDLSDGSLRIEVHEFKLGRILVEGADRIGADYVRDRLAWPNRHALNILETEAAIRLLHQDARIHEIHARLRPGQSPGSRDLEIRIVENETSSIALRFSNSGAPSTGEELGEVFLQRDNLVGRGDRLVLWHGLGEGLNRLGGEFTIPIHASDTLLSVYARRDLNEIAERPFESLDIESHATTYGVGLFYPVVNRAARRVELGLALEHRSSKNYLLGSRFSFSSGVRDGAARVTAARLHQALFERRQNWSFSLSSTVSVGLDLLNATALRSGQDRDEIADSEFVSWLGQLQYTYRFSEELRHSLLLLRADAQLSNEPLFPMEQFAIGGRRTVRGYSEYDVVRDQGMAGSLELRIPVTRVGGGTVEFAPFFDLGRAWDRRSDRAGQRRSRETRSSVGAGLRYSRGDRLALSVYWGAKLNDAQRAANGLQRAGIHLDLTVRAF